MFDRDTSDAIELMIDVYNDRHADALALVARYYLGLESTVAAQIASVDEKRMLLAIDLGQQLVSEAISFESEPPSADAVADNLLLCLALARENAPDSEPQTRIERDIARSKQLGTYRTSVKATRRISSNIQQITFAGGLDGLPDIGHDAFVYVIVPDSADAEFSPDFSMSTFRQLQARQGDPDFHGAYYSIRSHRGNEVDIWFVLHENPGPLARWAAEASVGDRAALWGPRSTFDPPGNTNRYLFVADETAQAAVLSTIESLQGRSYQCLFETRDATSCYTLADREQHVEWILRQGRQPGEATGLAQRLTGLSLADDELYVFGAGEARQMAALRKLLLRQFKLRNSQVTLTGYWRKAGA